VRICVYEDIECSRLDPLTLARPSFDLRCGASSLLERQVRRFAASEVGVLVRPMLADSCRLAHPEIKVNDGAWLRRGPTVLVNARWLSGAKLALTGGPEVGVVNDQIAYVVPPDGETIDAHLESLSWRLNEWKQTLPRQSAGGSLIAYPWDLVERNGDAIGQDYSDWNSGRERAPLPAGATIIGPAEQVLIDPAACVEPLVVLDATKGPVLIDRGAVIQAFSRLEGPCYVGPDSHIMGAKLRGGSIGPQCRVGGEVEASILHGHANKAHDGFLGHSYVGEWVNLAAGTQVSDLRADYGTIGFRVGGRSIDSGLMKAGAYFGDHIKTSINALINTGTMAGPFSQFLASGGLLPRVVPPFCRVAHGRLQERSDLREMFDTAAVMMGRRQREWKPEYAELFLALYEQTECQRRQIIREADQRRLRRVV
jgi:UDP-N-acetylglucosamine diphosphorylase / glucose-1-phosphate thymidylyltransferase / UDP-N-acetylgalactosamine diphosphorylase / glucosamine-1-phosphate N-acetyltransferase / galactosamine-1-phosphate N-acetyltransferase